MSKSSFLKSVVPSEDYFAALELRRTTALVNRDLESMEKLHSEEYELITPAGKIFSRKDYFAAIADAPFYSGWTVEGIRCCIAERLVVIRYRAVLLFPYENDIECWHTDTYQQDNLGWRALWSQATQIRRAGSQQ